MVCQFQRFSCRVFAWWITKVANCFGQVFQQGSCVCFSIFFAFVGALLLSLFFSWWLCAWGLANCQRRFEQWQIHVLVLRCFVSWSLSICLSYTASLFAFVCLSNFDCASFLNTSRWSPCRFFWPNRAPNSNHINWTGKYAGWQMRNLAVWLY